MGCLCVLSPLLACLILHIVDSSASSYFLYVDLVCVRVWRGGGRLLKTFSTNISKL